MLIIVLPSKQRIVFSSHFYIADDRTCVTDTCSMTYNNSAQQLSQSPRKPCVQVSRSSISFLHFSRGKINTRVKKQFGFLPQIAWKWSWSFFCAHKDLKIAELFTNKKKQINSVVTFRRNWQKKVQSHGMHTVRYERAAKKSSHNTNFLLTS